jgi:glycosyltransferase involved in cell wall biosynthesis
LKYIFLSSLFPKQLTSEIEKQSKGYIAYAANAHQWNIVNGLSEIVKDELFIITAPVTGSFPAFYKRLFVSRCKFMVNNHENGLSVGYFNLAVIKNRFITNALKKALVNEIKKSINKPIMILVYGMYVPYIEAAIYAKKRFSNIKLCSIVPDLPEYMANSTGFIWTLRGLIQKDAYRLVPEFDSFVLLTDAMVDRLNLQNKPWIRIEGMIDPDEHLISDAINKVPDKKIVMYSGTLAYRYGILDLLEAFESIKEPDYELWICGAGNTEDDIKQKAKADNRIRFFGLVSREKVLEMQQSASVLVNPRNSQSEYTKYSFPSKTMEYLLSGKPAIMRKLSCIPDEYHKHLFFTSDDSIEALQKVIVAVCEMSSEARIQFGFAARDFVLTKKNYMVQVDKIIGLVNVLTNKR